MYLDFAASTPVLPEVREVLNEVLDIYGNPSSIHDEGRKASKVIDKAKEIISSRLNCDMDELYFTSGASMSNSVAIEGFMQAHQDAFFITSKIEHNDILLCANNLFGDCEYIDVDHFGMIDLNQLKELDNKYKNDPVLYSIQMANSEVGTIQSMEEISKIVHRFPNHYLHTDATQFIPYYRMDVKKYGIDMLSMSGQKIGSIKGTGLLYVSKDIILTPIIWGEQGLIGGTENVHGIACLGKAFECLTYPIAKIKSLQSQLFNGLPDDIELFGSIEHRLPNNIMVRFPNISSETMVSLLNENGICASGGSACSSKSNKPSHVLLAMGYSEQEANECVRFTLSKDMSSEDVEQAIKIINECYELLRCL